MYVPFRTKLAQGAGPFICLNRPFPVQEVSMKLVLEVLISLVLHPIAVVLAWVNILSRGDLSTGKKVVWLVVTLIWGLGPILYMIVGDGQLW